MFLYSKRYRICLLMSCCCFLLTDDVQRSGGRVLVHCVAGVSRSATITIAYIMLRTRLSMMEAFHFVKRHRHIVAPNFNFMGQLMELERRLQDGSISRDLTVDLGIDADLPQHT